MLIFKNGTTASFIIGRPFVWISMFNRVFKYKNRSAFIYINLLLQNNQSIEFS